VRGRVVGAVVAAVSAACLSGAPLDAAPGDSTSTDTDQQTGTIIPTAIQSVRSSSGSGPTCRWDVVTDLGVLGNVGANVNGEWVREGPDGTEVLYYRTDCPDGQAPGYFWVPPVNVGDLRADAYDRVARQLPLPSTNISPDPATGALVNFGLWLAVDDPGAVSATAAVGPVWVTITATYGLSTWDMGTGEPFACEGLGTAIVDLDTDEQGPCGFTYEQPSAPRFTGGGMAYEASVTGTWSITWVDYTGATGTLDSLQRTTPFDYQVREIQTVGVAEP
jgi:hypothetical protein